MEKSSVWDRMIETNQWHIWENEDRKAPIGSDGKCQGPTGSYDEMLKLKERKGFKGMSFKLGNGFFGFDLDRVVDPKTKEWKHERSKQIVDELIKLGFYMEYSVSGSGIHAIGHCDQVEEISPFHKTGFNRTWKDSENQKIEIYISKKNLALTGDLMEDQHREFDDDRCPEVVARIFNEVNDEFNKGKKHPTKSADPSFVGNFDDDQVRKHADILSKGKSEDLLNHGHESSDQSSDDIKVLNWLAMGSHCDHAQMKRIFIQSALYSEDRVQKHGGESGYDSYLDYSITKAIEGCPFHFDPNYGTELDRANDSAPKIEQEIEAEPEKVRHGSSRTYRKMNKDKRPVVELNRVVWSENSKGESKPKIKPKETADLVDEIEEHLERIDHSDQDNILFRVRNVLSVLRGSIREDQRSDVLKVIESDLKIKPLTKDIADSYLGDYIDFRAYDKHGDLEPTDKIPPKVIKDLLEKFESQEVREIYGTVQFPYYTRSWDFVKEPGWNSESKLFYDPYSAVEIEDVPIDVAVDELFDLLNDFPFDGSSNKINALAMWFTIGINTALPGGQLRPLFPIIANVPESGKTTLAQMISTAITGQILSINPLPDGKEELRKTVETCVLEESGVILLDNAEEDQEVGSPTFASFITSEKIRFRKMGGHSGVRVPNNFVWTITGNRIRLNDDLTKRSCFIELKSNKSFENRSFSVDDLVNHVLTIRPRICSCVYSIINEWIRRGRPKSNRKSRFKEWGKVMGGIFNMLDEITEKSDDEGRIFSRFMENQSEVQARFNVEEGIWIRAAESIIKQIGLGVSFRSNQVHDIFYIPDGKRGKLQLKEGVESNIFGEIEHHRKHFEDRTSIVNVLGGMLRNRARDKQMIGDWLLVDSGKCSEQNVKVYKIIPQESEEVQAEGQMDLLESPKFRDDSFDENGVPDQRIESDDSLGWSEDWEGIRPELQDVPL